MGLFDRLFGSNADENVPPDIRFGRYSDSHKSSEQYDAWDRSLEKFDQKEYIGAYKDFFFYLRDEKEENVTWVEEKGKLTFEIYQGSKKITGWVDGLKIRVEARIVQSKTLDVGFMNRLISHNFNLEYSRFALDEDNCIVIVFDSFLLDGSPYKFYYALRELAINADKQDDLLLDEFSELLPIESSHLVELSDLQKEAKYNFIKTKIEQAFEVVENGSLDKDEYPGGVTYLLLDLVYRLDFLVKPEGFMMETLERINRLYFSNDQKTTQEKNNMIQKELKSLIDRPKEDFFKEMYRVQTTFGITKPINLQRIRGVITGELSHMDWYQENKHPAIALSIPGYIVGNCLFNYAVPKGVLDLFVLYFKVMEPAYFKSLGFQDVFYEPSTKKLNTKLIKKGIKQIAQENKHLYLDFSPNTSLLEFGSLLNFSRSYLIMVKELELTAVN